MKKLLTIILGIALLIGLTACSDVNPSESNENPTPTVASDENPAPTEEQEQSPEVYSGKLVIYSAGPGGLSKNLADAFSEKTGIEVDLFQGTTGSVLGRLESEKSNPIADVVVLASWPSGMSLKSEGLLLQYNEAKNANLLYEKWNDDNYLFGYSASALGITYNTLLVDEPGQDWFDFANPEFKDIVTMPDPSQSGSALDFVAGYLSNNPDNGWELFEALKTNGILVDGANRPALDAVVTGSKGVVLAGVDYMAYGDMAKGEPINIVYPSSGTVVNPRPAMILKSSENVVNAKAYIDFILSEEGQKLVADAYILPGRTDIAAHPDRLGIEDIPQFDIDWDWMMNQQEAINEDFNDIMK